MKPSLEELKRHTHKEKNVWKTDRATQRLCSVTTDEEIGVMYLQVQEYQGS